MCSSIVIHVHLFVNQELVGFLRISCEGDVSDVPYVKLKNEKHLPVFYFDGDIGALQGVTISMTGWELAHLRLLYNAQGVREELIKAPSSSRVAPLSSVLQLFPPSASVEKYWPEKDFLPRSGGIGGWTKLTSFSWLPLLTPVKEWPGFFSSPYAIIRVHLLSFGQIDALNIKPSQNGLKADLLITLPDLASCLGVDLEEVGRLLVRLKVTLYSPNSGQAALLEIQGKAAMMKPVPLLLVNCCIPNMFCHNDLLQVGDVVKNRSELEKLVDARTLLRTHSSRK